MENNLSCKGCGATFTPSWHSQRYCNVGCRPNYNKLYRLANKERLKAYKREHFVKNREKYAESALTYYYKNREEISMHRRLKRILLKEPS